MSVFKHGFLFCFLSEVKTAFDPTPLRPTDRNSPIFKDNPPPLFTVVFNPIFAKPQYVKSAKAKTRTSDDYNTRLMACEKKCKNGCCDNDTAVTSNKEYIKSRTRHFFKHAWCPGKTKTKVFFFNLISNLVTYHVRK